MVKTLLFYLAVVAAALFVTAAPAATTTARPWPVPPGWHAPRQWLGHPSTPGSSSTGAWCIHEHEGAWNDATGNGYEGGMQFLRSTWQNAGGSVDPKTGHWASIATPREQLYRAYVIWDGQDRHSGDGRGSWAQWGTRSRCGLY